MAGGDEIRYTPMEDVETCPWDTVPPEAKHIAVTLNKPLDVALEVIAKLDPSQIERLRYDENLHGALKVAADTVCKDGMFRLNVGTIAIGRQELLRTVEMLNDDVLRQEDPKMKMLAHKLKIEAIRALNDLLQVAVEVERDHRNATAANKSVNRTAPPGQAVAAVQVNITNDPNGKTEQVSTVSVPAGGETQARPEVVD